MTSGLLAQARHPKKKPVFFENWKRAQASNGRLCPPAGLGAACPPQVLQLFAPAKIQSAGRERRAGADEDSACGQSEAREEAPDRPPGAAGSSSHSLSTRVPRRRAAYPRALRHGATRTCVRGLLPKAAGPLTAACRHAAFLSAPALARTPGNKAALARRGQRAPLDR